VTDERFSCSIVGFGDIPFAVQEAFVRGKRSGIFNCMAVMCPHEHMTGLESEVEGSTEFLDILEAFHGVYVIRPVSTCSPQIVR
jgi:hypothetical protein